ncbi:hypothetical protein TYRP_005262 [Tyrophagus putrescentiae]|nr:hypothetical protein TYRP_005262 [Tyrophagus putrescentiae]
MHLFRYFLIVLALCMSFPAALGRVSPRQFSIKLSNLGHWMAKAKSVEELDQVMAAWRLLFREQPLSTEESSLMMQLNGLVAKKRARLSAVAKVALEKAARPVASPRPIVVTYPSAISTTTERLQARQLGTYPSVNFYGPRLPIASISSALPVEVKGSGTVQLLLTCFANLTLCSFKPPAALAAAAGSKPVLSVTQAPVIEPSVSSYTVSPFTAGPTTAMPVLPTTVTTEAITAKPTTKRPVLSTTASAKAIATKPSAAAAKPVSPTPVMTKAGAVKSTVLGSVITASSPTASSVSVKPSIAKPAAKKPAQQKTIAPLSPSAVASSNGSVKSSAGAPPSLLPAATVASKVAKGKPASTVSEKQKGKADKTVSVTVASVKVVTQAATVGKIITSGNSEINSSPAPEKRAPSSTTTPLSSTTSSTTADPSFYIVSPYPVTDAPADFSTISTPKLESHWPDLYVHQDGQVVDHGYPWNLHKDSDHSLYEAWSRWRYNESEGVNHDLTESFGEVQMPKRWPKTLPSQTPRPVDVGIVAVVDSATIAIDSGKTVVSPPADIAAEKINTAAVPSTVKWEHLPVVFLFCLCVSLAAALFVVLGKGGHPLLNREIASSRLDKEVGEEAYDSEAEWASEADTDSVDEKEEMPTRRVFRRKAPLATVRRGRLRGAVDSAALREFQQMTSVAGHRERFEPHSAGKLAAAEKATEQELKRLMRGTAV